MFSRNKKYFTAHSTRDFVPMVSDEQRKLEEVLRGMELKEVAAIVKTLDAGLASMSDNTELFVRMIFSDLNYKGAPSINLAMLYNCSVGDVVVKADGRWVLEGIAKDSYSDRIKFEWAKC